MTENRYNLLDEAWIPIADMGKAGLLRVFGGRECRALGGTAVQKIAVLKLLIAMPRQRPRRRTPKNGPQWGRRPRRTVYRVSEAVAGMPSGCTATNRSSRCPPAPRPNSSPMEPPCRRSPRATSTLLTQLQLEPVMSDASRALLLVEQMGFGLGGKKTDNSVILSKGYAKGKSAKPGPSVCHMGLLHSFLLGDSILETVWLNLLTRDIIADAKQWEEGLGAAPWEKMPEGEDCPSARALKASLMGRLVPLSRFCLLREDGLHYTEGIVHPDYQEPDD